jgi:WXG100 family type VII secretion target
VDVAAEDHVFAVPNDIRAVGQNANRVAQDTRMALKSLSGDVDQLLAGGWAGGAASSFEAGWRECHDGVAHVIAALAVMAEKLGGNADALTTTDTGVAESVTAAGAGDDQPGQWVLGRRV